jgi:RNA polymerase sigma-70 factor (ECF subfamily)
MTHVDGDFSVFYSRQYAEIVAQLYAITGDISEAQDCAQEAFVKAWSAWAKFESTTILPHGCIARHITLP